MPKKKNNILKKQLLSEIIDITICVIPAIGSYYLTELKFQFSSINVLYLLSIIYFVYGILLTFIADGRSIGDNIMKIELISTKTGNKSKASFLIREVIKSGSIFYIADLQNIEYIVIIVIFLLLFPFKFTLNKYIYYSLLSFGSKSTFIAKH